MDIAIIGPSGAGKGTHALRLAAQFNLLHLCTGDLLRRNLAEQTALGLLARKYMDSGSLVPDEVVDAMVEECLRRAGPGQGILFDGFPRTIYQAKFLDSVLRELGRRLEAVFYLKVSEEELLRRIEGRLICSQCHQSFHRFYHPFRACPTHTCGGEHLQPRPDDTPERARSRLRVFRRVSAPMVDYYQDTGRLILIDAEGPLPVVQRTLVQALTKVQARAELSARPEETAQLHPPPVTMMNSTQTHSDRLDLVLLGAPGSGKGTQATVLSQKFHIPHIATGDLFREHLKNQTELGKLAKTYMDRGQLVPDDVTESMVQERLSQPDAEAGFLLDGFPRTLAQAEALTEMLNRLGRRLAGVLLVDVSDQEIIRRLSGRLICRQCQTPYHVQFKPPAKPGVCDACGGELYQRDDDKPETIANRLKVYHEQTEPVIEYYRNAGLVFELDGEKAVEEVTAQAVEAIEQLAGQLRSRST